jgi:hypothetical protein
MGVYSRLVLSQCWLYIVLTSLILSSLQVWICTLLKFESFEFAMADPAVPPQHRGW